MHVPQHYSKAPIVEAIIDIRVEFSEEFSKDTLQELYPLIKDAFPAKEELYQNIFSFQAGPIPTSESENQQIGLMFKSSDDLKRFQATSYGFTFNRLKPYDRWEAFRSEAQDLWNVYKSVCRPTCVTRVAMRYINKLDLPGSELDLKKYLRILPDIPQTAAIPQNLHNFFMQLQIPLGDIGCMLVINEALAPSTIPDTVSIILDFDFTCQQRWDSNNDEVWELLDRLRYRKDEVFEASITDETRQLIT